MNKDRRSALAKAENMIEDAKSIVETARDEEQEYYDNMPENMQSGEKGDAAQSAVSELDEAISALDQAIENMQNAMGG